ncbi:hypothetical protein AK812_SmicGene15977 [Symbiodinium microadriaticum]|uniref:Uncharacterized protein n=1 Tax=Symbiodinium microadriaticum TaxID=2951 RepID=A0A1Q9E1K5_SYMMI|nr:hypothetical protein AK812_SmicGene15977 [Symbiodinium microadriaticum]
MEGIPQVKEIALDAVSAFSGGRVDPVYLSFVCAAVTVWLIMFCHMWSLRRTLSRVFFVASQMQSQMDSVKWQVDAVKNSVDAVTARMEAVTTGIQSSSGFMPSSSGDDVASLSSTVRELASMHSQFYLNCEDLRSLCLTSQHSCDMMGTFSKHLHHLQTEMEDLVRLPAQKWEDRRLGDVVVNSLRSVEQCFHVLDDHILRWQELENALHDYAVDLPRGLSQPEPCSYPFKNAGGSALAKVSAIVAPARKAMCEPATGSFAAILENDPVADLERLLDVKVNFPEDCFVDEKHLPVPTWGQELEKCESTWGQELEKCEKKQPLIPSKEQPGKLTIRLLHIGGRRVHYKECLIGILEEAFVLEPPPPKSWPGAYGWAGPWGVNQGAQGEIMVVIRMEGSQVGNGPITLSFLRPHKGLPVRSFDSPQNRKKTMGGDLETALERERAQIRDLNERLQRATLQSPAAAGKGAGRGFAPGRGWAGLLAPETRSDLGCRGVAGVELRDFRR